jgi:hypothetical protein
MIGRHYPNDLVTEDHTENIHQFSTSLWFRALGLMTKFDSIL